MQRRLDTFKYIFFDFISASLAWGIFFAYRKFFIEAEYFGEAVFNLIDKNFIAGITFIPLCWILLYIILGTYTDVYRKSRLKEFGKTILSTFIGVLIIFFILILDDVIFSYRTYYLSFAILFFTHLLITFIVRFIQLTQIAHRMRKGKIKFNTLIIGGGKKALKLYKELTNGSKSFGYNNFLGYINPNGKKNQEMVIEKHLDFLGNLTNIHSIIQDKKIEEVIIALETSEHTRFKKILNVLQNEKVIIKIIPDMYDIMIGKVKMEQIFGAILIEISPEIMPQWQKVMKRFLDIFISIFALIILFPVMIFAAIRVKLSSKGPIFYKQTRLGKNGNPFKILKFRSMYVDAEVDGPALSSKNDTRITKWGKFMRKIRLDECPQFFNVLLGEMSLVGPRPERQHYIDQIKKKAPHYVYLLKVRPGITSWGQVKYGYAENVNQMVERLKFDLLYIENMSILVDFKILIYTVLIILQGRGK